MELVIQRKQQNVTNPGQIEKQKEEINLDETSLKLLKRYKQMINRTDLFNALVNQNIKDDDSKRIIRQMIFPDSQQSKDQFTFSKKTFSQNVIHELKQKYKN